jgi:hypothetical protein
MSITDQQLLGEIQEAMIEPNDGGATWPSQLWTASEVLSYLNNRQNQFLRDTGLLISRAQIPTTPNVLRQPLPSDTMILQDLSWEASNGDWSEVPRADTWEADNSLNNWPYNMIPIPQMYTDSELPTLQVQIMPAPSDAGVLWALYVAITTTLTGSGTALDIPDEFTPAVKWGTVADMLSKVGRALDRGRAALAESRYQEGVAAAIVMIEGWETEGANG